MANMLKEKETSVAGEEETETETEEEEEGETPKDEDWADWDEEGDGDELGCDSPLRCLFCVSEFDSSGELFEHCVLIHRFDFHKIRKALGLDFYASFKLINYVRFQVAENRCWSWELAFQVKKDLHSHLHETFSSGSDKMPWDDDRYLKPFMQDDPLLYIFNEDSEDDEDTTSLDKMKDLISFGDIHNDNSSELKAHLHDLNSSCEDNIKEIASSSFCNSNTTNHFEKVEDHAVVNEGNYFSLDSKLKDGIERLCSAKVEANAIQCVNKSYFGSYSSFGIHREMISDKVRTEAYRDAILSNPSLLHGAVVLDVGCGTGILSLFAAQAGASSVIAVDGSDKMAAVAMQIAKDNGFLWDENHPSTGVMRVIHGMVEELDKSKLIQPKSIDVLVSEWMGYCLLYESMLSSILYARDQWLKPGGAILPDTATMFVAGFGRSSTSLPFWEDVYGFNMSCIGKELIEEAARFPIVDVVDSRDIITNTASLQSFDLVKMTTDDVDFTSTFELMMELGDSINFPSDKATTCYGVVLWFETGFTGRFCKEKPIVLSTSPHTPPTHWSQTILTFREPITMALGKPDADTSAAVGSVACPAVKLVSRISIARAPQHRCIDISLEIAGFGSDERKRSWPVQIFNLS